MEMQEMVAGITKHAAQRVMERTGLGPSIAQDMLDAGQFFYAGAVLPEKPRYALLFDSCTHSHVVAVLAPNSKTVVTFLTLEQYENSIGRQVSPLRLALARLALLKQAPAAEPAQPVSAPLPQWRFGVTLRSGEEVEIAVFEHQQVCTEFLFVLPPSSKDTFVRRARRVVRTRKFAQWFLQAIAANPDAAQVESAWAICLDATTHEQQWRADVTKKLQEALAAPEQDLVQASLKAAAKGSRRALSRQAKQEQRALRARTVIGAPTEVVLCI